MTILADYIIRTCYDSTINEFIVIRVLLNQTKAEMGVIETGKRTAYNGVYNIMSHCCIRYTLNNFLIFVQYFIAHAQLISPIAESIPSRSRKAMHRKHLHQAIGVKNNKTFHHRS